MNTKTNESINKQIQHHETNVQDWIHNTLATELYHWHDLFNKVFFEFKLKTPIVSFEYEKITTLGHYVLGRNAIGAYHNINLNVRHIHQPKWLLLAVLLHEMGHQWDLQKNNRDVGGWYHSAKFRKKLQEIGITCHEQGYHLQYGEPFLSFLKKHDINVHEAESFLITPIKGNSKLKKYQCACPINVRVADRRFSATCNLCQKPFHEVTL